MSRPELRIDDIGQYHAHEERNDNTRMADDEGFARLLTYDAHIELHTDNEHEQDQSDLTDHIERDQRVRREQKRESFREKMAQNRGPQNDTGNNFSDYTRLSEIFEQIGKKLSQKALKTSIPHIVGAVIGGTIDTSQMINILKYANIFYCKRFILEKEENINLLLDKRTDIIEGKAIEKLTDNE